MKSLMFFWILCIVLIVLLCWALERVGYWMDQAKSERALNDALRKSLRGQRIDNGDVTSLELARARKRRSERE
jgi:Flp pilus assembly protein TadG